MGKEKTRIMKKLLSLALIALPFVAFSQDKLNGDWKEVNRMTNGKSIGFKDTIKIQFMLGGEYVWQKGGGFIYKGTYKIKGNDLDMGARYFTIINRSNNSLKIKDEAGTYELVPYTPNDGPGTLQKERAAGPVTSINQMKGHWSVFKGTLDKTVPEIDYRRKIKMIEITGDIAGDGKLGMVWSTNDGDTNPSWYVKSFSNQTLYVGGKDERVLKVLKCEDNEFVVEENGMTYFMRRFKK
jgi:hypothetical protein